MNQPLTTIAPAAVSPYLLMNDVERKAFSLYRDGHVLHVRDDHGKPLWYLVAPGASDTNAFSWSSRQKPAQAFFAFADTPDDSGSQPTTWAFSLDRFKQVHNDWAEACRWADSFNQHSHSLDLDLKAASNAERTLARRLKRDQVLHMAKEGADVVLRLCQMGLARVRPEGVLEATTRLFATPIPAARPAMNLPAAPSLRR